MARGRGSACSRPPGSISKRRCTATGSRARSSPTGRAILSSSDVGASFRYNLPGNYGDIHGGFYNGETYTKPELNDQKAFMVRGSFRPLRMHPVLRGHAGDGVLRSRRVRQERGAPPRHRRRDVRASEAQRRVQLSLASRIRRERPLQKSTATASRSGPRRAPLAAGKGCSATTSSARTAATTRRRSARSPASRTGSRIREPCRQSLLFDVEQVNYDDFVPARPTERRFAVHALVNF